MESDDWPNSISGENGIPGGNGQIIKIPVSLDELFINVKHPLFNRDRLK